MNNILFCRSSLFFCYLAMSGLLVAQSEDPPGLYVGPGSTFTVGEGSAVSIIHGDVHIDEGATLINDGDLTVGRDLIVDGAFQTTLRGTEENPEHGRIHVAGDAEYRGSLAVAIARGSTFRSEQDFIITTYAASFGRLTASALPGDKWTSEHRDNELVVRLNGIDPDAEEVFGIEVEAALLDERVLVDWVVQFDDRTINYVVERFDLENGWTELGNIPSLGLNNATAYFSSIDNEIPTRQQVLRYRIRLEDENGLWHYSHEALVGVGSAPELRVFPNPVTGQHVRLLGVDPQRELSSLRLVSTQGQILQEYPVARQEMHVLELPGDIQGAIHFIEVTYADGGKQSCQVVVVR